jgi:hypothetical protein
MRRWLSTTAILLAGLSLTTVATQLAAIGVLDITPGRLVTSAAIVAAQGFAVVILLKRADGGSR